jgi:hypothetical protein
MMTRAGIAGEGYEITDRGTIASPGKFESGPWWVIALWTDTMDGGADIVTTDNDETSIWWYCVNADLIACLDLDTAEYPAGSWIGVWEDSQGFVRRMTRATVPKDYE